MQPKTTSVSNVGSSTVIPLDFYAPTFNVGIGCTATGTTNYKVQHTYDDVLAKSFSAASATWFDHATITGKTASADGAYTSPVRGVRVTTASGTGTVVMTVIQAGLTS